MQADLDPTWTTDLTEEQRLLLAWLQAHRCHFLLTRLSPESDQAEPGVVVEVRVDSHALIRTQGRHVGDVFDRVAQAARIFVMHGEA